MISIFTFKLQHGRLVLGLVILQGCAYLRNVAGQISNYGSFLNIFHLSLSGTVGVVFVIMVFPTTLTLQWWRLLLVFFRFVGGFCSSTLNQLSWFHIIFPKHSTLTFCKHILSIYRFCIFSTKCILVSLFWNLAFVTFSFLLHLLIAYSSHSFSFIYGFWTIKLHSLLYKSWEIANKLLHFRFFSHVYKVHTLIAIWI